MAAILLCIAIGYMSYEVVELYLIKYYQYRYDTTLEDAKFEATQSMKTWGPLILLLVAAIIPETVLASIASGEFMLVCYGLYMDKENTK